MFSRTSSITYTVLQALEASMSVTRTLRCQGGWRRNQRPRRRLGVFCGGVGGNLLVELWCCPVQDSNVSVAHVPMVSETISIPQGDYLSCVARIFWHSMEDGHLSWCIRHVDTVPPFVYTRDVLRVNTSALEYYSKP